MENHSYGHRVMFFGFRIAGLYVGGLICYLFFSSLLKTAGFRDTNIDNALIPTIGAFWLINIAENPLRKLLGYITSKSGSIYFLILSIALTILSQFLKLEAKAPYDLIKFAVLITILSQLYRGLVVKEKQVLINAAPRAGKKLFTQNRV